MFRFVYGKAWISKVFLAILAFVFIIGTAVMWGPGGLNFGGGNFIAKVGDISITPKEYILELNRLNNLYGSKLSREQIKKEALNNLLLTAIFAYLAEKNHFYVAEDEIRDFIKRQFSDKKGHFQPQLFENYLKALKITPQEFENMVRITLLANKYKRAVYSTTYANQPTVEVFLLPFTLQLEVEVIKLSYEGFESKISVNEKDLKEFYNSIKDRFALEEPPKVEVFKANTPEEARRLVESIKEGKTIQPYKVIPLNNDTQRVPKELIPLIEKLKNSKNIAVVKTDKGEYLIGIYKKGKKRIPSFDEVRNEVIELYKRLKTVEWMHSHIEELAAKLLSGKYKGTVERGKVLAYNLMENFHLSPEDLFRILAGETLIKVPTPDGIAVIKVLSVEWKKDISPQLEYTYSLTVRNSFYLKKLQEVLNYVYRNGEVEIKVNKRLLEAF